MNVSLTPELEKMVSERVASGRYSSASEVIREALRLLEERDQLNRLRNDVRAGLEQLDEGRSKPFDCLLLEGVKRRGRERAGHTKGRDLVKLLKSLPKPDDEYLRILEKLTRNQPTIADS